ncbi:MAG: PQQ-binding-like beta-propeller repeat protein [Acidobacteriota bacterium]
MDYRAAPSQPQPDRSVLVVGLSGHVYAIDRATGELRWHNDLSGGGLGHVAIAVGYGVVIASAGGAAVFCIDYLGGETRWQQPTHGRGRATILIEADQIVVAKGGHVDCFSPEGHRLWGQPLRGAGMGRAALGYPGNVVQSDDPGSE